MIGIDSRENGERVIKRGQMQKGFSMSVIVSTTKESSVHWKESVHACLCTDGNELRDMEKYVLEKWGGGSNYMNADSEYARIRRGCYSEGPKMICGQDS